MHRRLIYTTFNAAYLPLFDPFMRAIRRHSDVPVCVFTDQPGVKADIVVQQKLDWKTHKLDIAMCEFHKQFDSFLYLDIDILCLGSLEPVWQAIESDTNCVHGVMEHPDINACGKWHRMNSDLFQDGTPAFNAGTFGFHREMLPIVRGLRDYSDRHRDEATTDQPLFNAFLNRTGVIKPTLTPFVCLRQCMDSQEQATDKPLIHFVGHFGVAAHKIKAFKAYEDSHPQ